MQKIRVFVGLSFKVGSLVGRTNKRSRVEVVIVNASKMQRNNQSYFLFYVSDISDVLTAGLMKMQKKF